jgi:ferredoxin
MKILTRQNLDRCVEAMLAEKVRIVGPVMQAGQPVYASISRPVMLDFSPVIARNSIKDFFFPQTETVMLYTIGKAGAEIRDVVPDGGAFQETLILGARPCDAAGIASIQSVFTWQEENDPLFLERLARTTIVTLACVKGDSSCFCTSVDLAPDSTAGSDLLLRETVDGNFSVEPVTGKGEALMSRWETWLESGSATLKTILPPPVIEKSNLEKMLSWLSDPAHYEHEVWSEHAAKCLGCGACTYVCPTCHCFDLTDEGSAFQGERRKNWDACQFDHFTAHAGGHNPRPLQSQRWRNRFMCKFHFYPTKFSAAGCVGCGRCIRVCYVGLDIAEMMEKVTAYANLSLGLASPPSPAKPDEASPSRLLCKLDIKEPNA